MPSSPAVSGVSRPLRSSAAKHSRNDLANTAQYIAQQRSHRLGQTADGLGEGIHQRQHRFGNRSERTLQAGLHAFQRSLQGFIFLEHGGKPAAQHAKRTGHQRPTDGGNALAQTAHSALQLFQRLLSPHCPLVQLFLTLVHHIFLLFQRLRLQLGGFLRLLGENFFSIPIASRCAS